MLLKARELFLTITLVVGFVPVIAQAVVTCKDDQKITGTLVANRFYTVSLGCLVQVTPLNKPNLVYREYYFDERGRFLAFMSTPGEYETSTATRSYWLFPRKGEPTFEVTAEGTVTVTAGSGQKVKITNSGISENTNPWIQEFEGTSWTEPTSIGIGKDDFIQIQKYPGLLLDTGWRMGGQAYSIPDAISTFRDTAGNSCLVRNREIFDFTHGLYGEPIFLYETDAKLYEYLKGRCPQLTNL